MVLLKAIKQKGHLGKTASKIPGSQEEYVTLSNDFLSLEHGMQSLFIPPLCMANCFIN